MSCRRRTQSAQKSCAIGPVRRAGRPGLRAPFLNNKLLAQLPLDDYETLHHHLVFVSMVVGEVVYEAGDEVEYVYFPYNGMFSLLTPMQDGSTIETASVGREGAVGAMAGLGLHRTLVRVRVQLPLQASRITSIHFRRAVAGSTALRDMCARYNEVMLTQVRMLAACNALHQLEQRFCRWLLQSADRAETDEIELTQELLAALFGVRRTSISEVASKLQKLEAITYHRKVIKIIHRETLEALACECYETLLENEATLR